jgi:hypothetical protein
MQKEAERPLSTQSFAETIFRDPLLPPIIELPDSETDLVSVGRPRNSQPAHLLVKEQKKDSQSIIDWNVPQVREGTNKTRLILGRL